MFRFDLQLKIRRTKDIKIVKTDRYNSINVGFQWLKQK